MSDEVISTQTGQSGDLGGNAGQSVTGFNQASGNAQSPEVSWEERERDFLAKAYRQTQSMISKSENRQTSNFQSVIDQFKRDFGVTLTPEQAQEMTQNQSAQSIQQNAPVQAQAPVQNAPAVDAAYQGFMYYHGMNPNSKLAPLFRQMYDIQNTLGVQLEKGDEEYQKFLNPERKYQPNEFVNAWKQACLDKIVRMKTTQQQASEGQQQTNLGQMPLVGSRGRKSTPYDDKRSAKSYFSAYMSEKKL